MEKIEVYFREISYSKTYLAVTKDGVKCEIILYEKSIDDICNAIHCWLKGFTDDKLTFKNLKFDTSSENYYKIQEKTLLNEKSVYELFKEKGVNIGIWR